MTQEIIERYINTYHTNNRLNLLLSNHDDKNDMIIASDEFVSVSLKAKEFKDAVSANCKVIPVLIAGADDGSILENIWNRLPTTGSMWVEAEIMVPTDEFAKYILVSKMVIVHMANNGKTIMPFVCVDYMRDIMSAMGIAVRLPYKYIGELKRLTKAGK